MPWYYFLCFLSLCCIIFSQPSHSKNSPTLLFNEGFNRLYGESNIIPYDEDKSVQILMDERSSSGFRSKQSYVNGYFKASIKLPENHTAGVVVTFYTSNNQKYPYRHDEIDFEFLGRVRGGKWLVQTNFYGNGSTDRGREERYVLWFDPSEDFHDYTIFWNGDRITYYVDDVPIRHVKRVDEMGDDFPSKEMRLYGTIWNGSDWATNGGRDKLDLSYGPYGANFTSFVLDGCPQDSVQEMAGCNGNTGLAELANVMMLNEMTRMQRFRREYMTYSYCYDKKRYAVPLPECVFESGEFAHLQKLDPWTFGSGRMGEE